MGTVEEIWRYPVSSLGGEQLASIHVREHGIQGDRCWAIVDTQSGEAAAPEKQERWRPALFLNSRLNGEATEIGFPDGTWINASRSVISARLSDHFGFDVTARPYRSDDPAASSDVKTAENRYDPSPLHLVTTSALDHLATLLGQDAVQTRRFRPTLLLRTSGEAEFREKSWIGHELQIGAGLVARATEETKRCGMTLIAQPGIPENADILRTVLRHNRRNFGLYASIETAGTISVGDEVHLRKS
nr:MOSC N-terminal beta barrel domain-containing protein [Rhizobium sp. Leaf262]